VDPEAWVSVGRIAAALAVGVSFAAAVRKLVRRGRSIDLFGRVVVVTGGTRGVGLRIAEEAAEQGAKVAVCGRDLEAVSTALERLEETGAEVLARACDLGDRQAAEAFVDEVARRFGRIDVLVNNAGAIHVGPVETVTVERMEEALASNLWSAVHVTLRALPYLRERRGEGRIVHVTSVGGRAGLPHLLPYGTAKFALVGFSEALRAELAGSPDAPRVVTVIPGLMRTGSYYNAEFDGEPAAELKWFSIASSLPFLSIDAGVAARRILAAARDGRPFLRLAASGHALDWIHRLSPSLAVGALGLANRLLPRGGGKVPEPLPRGRHVASDLPGSFVLRWGDAAAAANNEEPPRPRHGALGAG
jgi:NAD(P)-dependent dehydrogenase (short-subunit alcohol dehydrogenase family)